MHSEGEGLLSAGVGDGGGTGTAAQPLILQIGRLRLGQGRNCLRPHTEGSAGQVEAR